MTQLVTRSMMHGRPGGEGQDFEATPAVDLPIGWKAGQQIRLRGVSFFALRDGLIAAIRDFSQSTRIAKSQGPHGPHGPDLVPNTAHAV